MGKFLLLVEKRYEYIAFIPADENIIYLGSDWDYSRTTGKYRNEFLNCNKKELEQMIKDGKAIIKEDL